MKHENLLQNLLRVSQELIELDKLLTGLHQESIKSDLQLAVQYHDTKPPEAPANSFEDGLYGFLSRPHQTPGEHGFSMWLTLDQIESTLRLLRTIKERERKLLTANMLALDLLIPKSERKL